MSLTSSLIPKYWTKRSLPIHRAEDGELPVYNSLQQEMDRIFDDFFTGFQWPTPVMEGRNLFAPCLDVTETETELKVTVELPGMDEKDIDLSLSNNALTIKGEKQAEKEDRTRGYYRVERSYGTFQRTIPIPSEIDRDKVEAAFKKGVLSITLPKTKSLQSDGKKIAIKKEA